MNQALMQGGGGGGGGGEGSGERGVQEVQMHHPFWVHFFKFMQFSLEPKFTPLNLALKSRFPPPPLQNT